MFIDPGRLMPVFNEAMESFMEADGLVIDLRGNPGGMPGMAMGMAGWLISEKSRRLGTMITRDTELKLIVFPRPKTYSGPVAVLVDGLSGSCSEIMAGGLKDLDRARIFGSRTMGAALPSVIEKLPNGDGFQYAFANYVSEGGEVLEGVGVIPHVEVAPSRDALVAGRDPVLDAAVAWIRVESASRSLTYDKQENTK
jgi:carboxyl-terminal processing protease